MASDAPNGVSTPRAVLRISADVQRRIAEQKQLRAGQTEAPPPAPEPVPEPIAVAVPPVPAPQTPPVDPRHDDPQYWRGRFDTSEGMLRVRGRELNELREKARQREAELQAQIDELRASTAPTAPDISAYFTPEQIERFGEEQCRIMVAAAQKAAGETVAKQIDQHVKPLVQARKDDATQRAEDALARFHRQLDELLPPNWREIDHQQPWLDWLEQPDEQTGVPRGETLRYHAARHDAPRTARVMLAWLETQRAPAQPTPPAPPLTPNGTGAGGGANNPAARQASATGVPSGAEITDYYKRAALGKVSDAERVAFEARLPQRVRAA